MCIRKVILILILTLALMLASSCGFNQDTDTQTDKDKETGSQDLPLTPDTDTENTDDTNTDDTNIDISTSTDISIDTSTDTSTDTDINNHTFDNFSTVQKTILSYDRLRQMSLSSDDYNTGSLYTKDELYKVKNQARLITLLSVPYPNASRAMKHFLSGTGEDFDLDVEKLLDDEIAKKNMLADVNKALRSAEELAIDGEKITIYQIEESLHHNLKDDWRFALGSYFTSIELYDVEKKSLFGATYYTAKLKYIVQDFYNWDKNDTNNVSILGVSPADLHQLHVNGEAQEFLTYGEIEFEIGWVKGVDASKIESLND